MPVYRLTSRNIGTATFLRRFELFLAAASSGGASFFGFCSQRTRLGSEASASTRKATAETPSWLRSRTGSDISTRNKHHSRL